MKHQLAIELFTLREECKTDFPGVLRAVKEMGWPAVEMAGYHGYDPEEIATVVKETGLQVAGMHVGFNQIVSNPDQVVREAHLFGTRDIVCPSVPPSLRTEEGYRETRIKLNEAADYAKENGLRISYHNHAYEFETEIEGKNALEYMLDPSAGNKVLAEIDVYWVKKAGYDPAKFIVPYANRMPLIHLKDMTVDEVQDFAEIGTGSIDFKPILKWGKTNGVDWYVVEQDRCPRSPMDCIEVSYTNLVQMISGL